VHGRIAGGVTILVAQEVPSMRTPSLHATLLRAAGAVGLALLLAGSTATAQVLPCPDDGIQCTADFIDPGTQQCVHRCVRFARCEHCDGGRCIATTSACRCTRAYVCPDHGATLSTPDGRIVFATPTWGSPMTLRAGSPPEGAPTTFHLLIVENGPFPKIAVMSPQSATPYWTPGPAATIVLGAPAVGASETFVVRDAGTDIPRFFLEAADGSYVGIDGGDVLRTGFGVQGAMRFRAQCALP
jgi:hypothetical protein